LIKTLGGEIMKKTKLRDIILIILLILVEAFFILIGPKLWGGAVAYKLWGRFNLIMAIVLLIVTWIYKAKNK